MLIKRVLVFSFAMFLCVQCFCAGIFKKDYKKEKEIIEALATVYAETNDVSTLKLRLSKALAALPPNKSVSVEVIKKVFVANKVAALSDSLNATSSSLFSEAVLLTDQLGDPELKLWVSSNFAFYLYTYRKYEQTYPLFVECIQIANELAVLRTIDAIATYKKIGFFLMTVGELETALVFFKKALTEADPVSREAATVLDNIGVIYLNSHKFETAESYFNDARQLAIGLGDDLRHAKVIGNLGVLKYKQQRYNEAKALLVEDLSISERGGYEMNSMYALVWLTRVCLASDNYEEAQKYLEKALLISNRKVHFKSSLFELSKLQLELAIKSGDEKGELLARRRVEELEAKLSYLDGEDVKIKVHWAMQKKNLQLKLDLQKAERDKEAAKKLLIIVLSLILAVGTIIFVFWLRKKYRKQADLLASKIDQLRIEKAKSEKKLEENSKTLDSYRTYLQEKNIQIRQLEIAISEVKGTSQKSEKYKDKMQQILTSHLVNNQTWFEFKNAFINENREYYSQLLENFPDLTDANLRVIFLMKMGMNNADIARVLGITLDAIKKAKQRLRKKYGEDFANIA